MYTAERLLLAGKYYSKCISNFHSFNPLLLYSNSSVCSPHNASLCLKSQIMLADLFLKQRRGKVLCVVYLNALRVNVITMAAQFKAHSSTGHIVADMHLENENTFL